MVTQASQWKKATSGPALQDLKLPSGNTCQVKAVGMRNLLAKGMIPNSLMAQIRQQLEKNSEKMSPAQREKAEAEAARRMMEDISKDPAKIVEVLEVTDLVVLEVVVQPEVLPAPDDENDRDPEQLYVDEVDIEDKFFIFNFAVGGTRNTEQFRGELASVVDPAEDEQPVVKKTKRTGGTTKSRSRK